MAKTYQELIQDLEEASIALRYAYPGEDLEALKAAKTAAEEAVAKWEEEEAS